MSAMDERPNFLLINCDDLGYGDLGCYGSPLNRTPHLDRLAGDGVRCTDFRMAYSVCSASRAAMLTGCYPSRIGFDRFRRAAGVLFPGDPEGIHPAERTIADLLRDRDYATRIIGKWHCGDQPEHLPTRHGFDGYFGIPYSNDMGRRAGGGPPGHPPLPLLRDEDVIQEQPDQAGLIERYVEDAVLFLRAQRRRPFFLYLAPFQVHLPLYAPARFVRESRNGRYGACVECVDWAVGVLLYELARLGLDRRTMVMFTSDNGSRCAGQGGSNAPLRGTKASAWEGGFRVPFIARFPGWLPSGTICREPVSSLDLLPTLVGLAGGRPPEDRKLDGRDILEVLRGESIAPSAETPFLYYHQARLCAVRRGPWKLFVRLPQPESETGRMVWAPGRALYNLDEDLAETTDVAARHPEVVAALMRDHAAALEDLGDPDLGAPGRNRRPVGWVEHPRPLTQYDPEHPYIMAEYDLTEAG